MRVTLTVLVCCVFACTPEAETPIETSVRTDSAGIEIITYLADPLSLPLDTLPEPPVRVISTDDAGEIVLHRLTGVAPLRGGGVAVGSLGSKTVYIFDGQGEHEGSLGRAGEGPGEFRGIWDLFPLSSDSIAVWDNWLGRLTVFTGDGEVARTVDLGRFLPASRGGAVHPLGTGLALVGIGGTGGRRAPGVYRDSAASFLFSADGDSVGSFGRFPGREVVYAGRVFGSLPFGSGLHSGVLFDHLLMGSGDRPELREHDTTGRVVRLIRWPDHDRSLSGERIADFIDFQLAGMSVEERREFATTLREVPFPQSVPVYDGFVVSAEGVVWLAEFASPGGFLAGPRPHARTWLLIDGENGIPLRRVTGPPGFTLSAVSEGLAYGIHRDELGVESVHLYEVPPATH